MRRDAKERGCTVKKKTRNECGENEEGAESMARERKYPQRVVVIIIMKDVRELNVHRASRNERKGDYRYVHCPWLNSSVSK